MSSRSNMLCGPCIKKRNVHRGYRDPKDTKYCPKHQCPVSAPGGIVCPRHKKGLHERCDIHSICDFRGCQNPKHSDGTAISHEFCREHACAIESCGEGKVYSPDQNVHSDLCARHALMKCLSPACQNWKVVGNFCPLHNEHIFVTDNNRTHKPFDERDESVNGESVHRKHHAGRSRSSSIDSIESMASLTSNKFSSSSLSSIFYIPNAGELLVALLLNDEVLSSLYVEALYKIPVQRFQDNFRRCLIQFAVHLRQENSSRDAKQAARMIRIFSRNAASIVCQTTLRQTSLTDIVNTASYRDDQEDRDSDWDSGGTNDENSDDEYSSDRLQELKELILSSCAIQLLRENMRLFVSPDAISRSLFQLWPVSYCRTQPLTIEYKVDWELPNFLKTCFVEGQAIGDVLTLTGNSVDAQASSCKSFLDQTWPTISSIMLQGCQAILHSMVDVTVQNEHAEMRFQNQHPTGIGALSSMSITATANHGIHTNLINAISWMSAAFRNSPHCGVSYSASLVKARESTEQARSLSIKVSDFDEIKANHSCWHALFPRGVIAKGFPFKSRKEGKGLEIHFADMVHMSRGLGFVEFNKGLLVEGLTSLLIPIADLPIDNALQWHFEDKTKQKSKMNSSISKILKSCGIKNWHSEDTPENLINRRCFLGWVAGAEVVIGTNEYQACIRPSRAKKVPTLRHLNSHTITIGANVMGFATATYQKTWLPFANPSQLMFPKDKDIYDLLADGKHNHLFVYDDAEGTAYCLPQANVVLYMAHAILNRREYKVFHGDVETSIGFAQPGPDGANEASKVLKESLKLKVRKDDTNGSVIFEDISLTFKDIWHTLNTIGAGLENVHEEYEKVGFEAPKYLHGVEFTDVVRMESVMKIKQAKMKFPMAWTHLKSSCPIVLFCNSLGTPIVPLHPSNLCDSWKIVPPKNNFLVLMGIAIDFFLEEEDTGAQGSLLHEKIEWIRNNHSFQYHKYGEDSPVFHTQQLRTVKSPRFDKSIRNIVKSHLHGCFIFSGEQTHSLCSSHCSVLSTKKSRSAAENYSGIITTPRETDMSSAVCSASFQGERSAQNSVIERYMQNQQNPQDNGLFSSSTESISSSSATDAQCITSRRDFRVPPESSESTSTIPSNGIKDFRALAIRKKAKTSTLRLSTARYGNDDIEGENLLVQNDNFLSYELKHLETLNRTSNISDGLKTCRKAINQSYKDQIAFQNKLEQKPAFHKLNETAASGSGSHNIAFEILGEEVRMVGGEEENYYLIASGGDAEPRWVSREGVSSRHLEAYRFARMEKRMGKEKDKSVFHVKEIPPFSKRDSRKVGNSWNF